MPRPICIYMHSLQQWPMRHNSVLRIPKCEDYFIWGSLYLFVDVCTVKYSDRETRRLPSPKYFGSFCKGKLLDEIFWTQEPDQLVNGPFDSEGDLNEAMMRKYTYNGGPPYRAEYPRKCLPSIFRDHEAILTHGDLQRKNIIIREKSHQSKEETRVVILDWEKSGWYPAYWEYCLFVLCGGMMTGRSGLTLF